MQDSARRPKRSNSRTEKVEESIEETFDKYNSSKKEVRKE